MHALLILFISYLFLLTLLVHSTMSTITASFGDLYNKFFANNPPISVPLKLIKFGSFRPLTTAGMEKIKSSIDTNKGMDSTGIIPDR